MRNIKLYNLLTVLFIAAGLAGAPACLAADVSSSPGSMLTRARMVLNRADIQLTEVERQFPQIVSQVERLEQEFEGGADPAIIKRALQDLLGDVTALGRTVAEISQNVRDVQFTLERIRDDARQRGDGDIARAAQREIERAIELDHRAVLDKSKAESIKVMIEQLLDKVGSA